MTAGFLLESCLIKYKRIQFLDTKASLTFPSPRGGEDGVRGEWILDEMQ
jgi:hypothetical protein